MASFGGAPSSANMSTDNPFAMPASAAGFQHGSAEQNDASSVLGYSLDSIGGNSPRASFTLPRSPSSRMRSRSARSHNDDDDDSGRRRDRSREREPVGTGFRLTSLEQTTGVHAREIQQLKTIVETLVADRNMTAQRLDSVFNHADVKFTEAISRVPHCSASPSSAAFPLQGSSLLRTDFVAMFYNDVLLKGCLIGWNHLY